MNVFVQISRIYEYNEQEAENAKVILLKICENVLSLKNVTC